MRARAWWCIAAASRGLVLFPLQPSTAITRAAAPRVAASSYVSAVCLQLFRLTGGDGGERREVPKPRRSRSFCLHAVPLSSKSARSRSVWGAWGAPEPGDGLAVSSDWCRESLRTSALQQTSVRDWLMPLGASEARIVQFISAPGGRPVTHPSSPAAARQKHSWRSCRLWLDSHYRSAHWLCRPTCKLQSLTRRSCRFQSTVTGS